jgi:glycerol dehydrogenase-like iron-containing ADH family enzyme
MGLVLRVHLISKSFALGIKNTGDMVSFQLRSGSTHHIHHAIDSPSRLSSPISEVWHGMKGAIKVAGAVYQQESMFSHTAIVQSSCELPTGPVKELAVSRLKKVKICIV